MRSYSLGWRLAMVVTLAAIVVAIGLLLSAAYVAASILGDDGVGLALMGAGAAVVAALLAGIAWHSERGTQ